MEEHPKNPHSPYGVTKLAAEQLCSLYADNFGVPAVSLRLFTVCGPRQRPDMMFHRLIGAALKRTGFQLFGDGSMERDFTCVFDVVEALMTTDVAQAPRRPRKSVDVLMQDGMEPKRTYDVPDKGILWGWEVSAYVLTKAISTGVFLLYMLALALGVTNGSSGQWSIGVALVFLLLTGVLLVMDLDRPDRFLNVLLRPQWRSW